MDESRFDRLTERQRECLRFVTQGLEVKEIARELGLTPSAVVERLRAARRTLDVETSREAARLLGAHENSGTYMRHVDMPPMLADIPYPLAPGLSSKDGVGTDQRLRMREVSAPFAVLGGAPAPVTSREWPAPWRMKGTRGNDLNLLDRFLASGLLTIAIAVGAAVILSSVVLLMSFLIEISRHGG